MASALCAGLILSVTEAVSLPVAARDLAISQVKLSSLLTTGAVCMIAAVVAGRGAAGLGWLAWIGRRSFYFYLSHMLIMGFAERALRKVPGLWDAQPAFVVALCAVTLGVCAGGAAMFDRASGRRERFRRAVGLA